MANSQHITKGSDDGKRDEFPTGAQRDSEKGKVLFHKIPFRALLDMQAKAGGAEQMFIDRSQPAIHTAGDTQRHDLIPQLMLDRLAALYGRGAAKYNDNNWQRGINFVRTFGSLLRHAFQWYWGDTSEDHLAAVIWNATTLMWLEAKVAEGERPEFLDDREYAMTRVVYSWNEGNTQHRIMDLDGWLTDAEAYKQCQAYWTVGITVHNVKHWLDN